MKKSVLFFLLVLVLVLTGCSGPEPAEETLPASTIQVTEARTNEEVMDDLPEESDGGFISVSQEEPELDITQPAESEETPPESIDKPASVQDRSEALEPASVITQPQSSAQPEATQAVEPPVTQPQATDPSIPESSVPEQPQESAEPEPETPKTIYDYEFDAAAIRSELIALGQSMGLTHITEDDGVPCTPDTCSWASPVTASESFQGDKLKRALNDYVTSMPTLLASYGGTQISCFTIYVQDNGGGSYTFYFLY